MNLEKLRNDFPVLSATGRVYLDSAATSLKPLVVGETIADWYTYHVAPLYRSIYTEAEYATKQYEIVREHTARLLGAMTPAEIIFTKNATEGINLVAASWGEVCLKAGDEIVLTELEHHANLLPWLYLAQKVGLKVRFLPIRRDGLLDLMSYNTLFSSRTKLVAITASSNVLGDIDDLASKTSFLEKVIHDAHKVGARVLVDAAQWVPHRVIYVQKLDVDFLVFSAHKMLGPTGVGIVYAKRDALEEMEPYQRGGGMVTSVAQHHAVWRNPPYCFEAGTPAIAEVMGFGAALSYYEKNIDYDVLRYHEAQLCAHSIEGLNKLSRVRILNPTENSVHHGHLVSFTIDGIHSHDVAAYLDRYGISVRAGNHCAQLLHKKLEISDSVRISFHVYNNHHDIDVLLKHLSNLHDKGIS